MRLCLTSLPSCGKLPPAWQCHGTGTRRLLTASVLFLPCGLVVCQVKDIKGACAEFQTVEEMLQKDISAKTVKNKGSHSRNLLRVCRGLDLNKRLFEYLLQDRCATASGLDVKAQWR